MSQEKRNFFPSLRERVQKTAVFLEAFLRVGAVETGASIRHLPRNKFVRDRVVANVIEWKSASAQKFLEAYAVQNAQRNDLLDVPWRSRQRFVVGKGAWRCEIELVRECARDPPAHGGCLPEGESHTQTRAPEKTLEIGLKVWCV